MTPAINNDHSSLKGSAPASPSNDTHLLTGIVTSRPPGLTGRLPSPIGKPGHSNTNSASSPLLTLTPNSQDGNSDWGSIGRQSSPYNGSDGPAMPNLHVPDHRRGSEGPHSNFSSFDMNDGDNDGLLGLQALRDRAHSSPGLGPGEGFPSSPGMRGHFSGRNSFTQQHDPSQDLSRSRERPPLPQPAQGENASHGSFPFSSTSSNRSVEMNASMESNDSRFGFGAIARPELRPAATDFDPSRRRTASSDNFQNPYTLQHQQQSHPQQQQGGYPDPAIAQKFGNLPTLGAHIQQQRVPVNPPETFMELHRPRHVRSVSQPMAPAQQQQYYQQQPGMQVDPRYMGGSAPHHDGGYKSGGPRNPSMAHPPLASSYDAAYGQKMPSMSNLPSQQGYSQQPFPHLQRRDALDFHPSPNTYSGGSVVAASADEIRAFGTPSMISPGQSPMQAHYGGHSRHPSDGGSMYAPSHSRQPSDGGGSMLSASSPLSHSSGVYRVQGGHMHMRQAPGDDDLAHPLSGEHIEIPDEHGLGGYMGPQQMMSGSVNGHSMSLDQMPMYHESQHRQPAQAPAMPKVIYCVKFKRTQRNFVLGPRISRDLKIGTYVKVEADRGEDLGIVVGRAAADKYNFPPPGRANLSTAMAPPGGLPGAGAADLKRISRLATHDEVSLLGMKREEEDELLKICRAKVRQRGLPMSVVDAEYQFDRHKLTFFFEAEGRVDFRELVRDLFSMYKTRIWMQQLDKNTSMSNQAIVSPQAASMQMDYGTPIIAPTSEFADSIVLGVGMSGVDAPSRTH